LLLKVSEQRLRILTGLLFNGSLLNSTAANQRTFKGNSLLEDMYFKATLEDSLREKRARFILSRSKRFLHN